jgi:flagellar capping protein FliD
MNRQEHINLLKQDVLEMEKFGDDKLPEDFFENFLNFLNTCSDSILFKFQPENILLTDRNTLEMEIYSRYNETILHVEIGSKNITGFYKSNLLDLDVESIKPLMNLLIV